MCAWNPYLGEPEGRQVVADVVVDISMSLDGFVAGPGDGLGRGLGEGGEAIHNWVMGGAWTYDDGTPFQASGVVTGGIQAALKQAQEIAGDKTVSVSRDPFARRPTRHSLPIDLGIVARKDQRTTSASRSTWCTAAVVGSKNSSVIPISSKARAASATAVSERKALSTTRST